ncbi:energy-coupling factor transporter transmembrane component T family protein [Clostridium sp. C105KSO13]|uniref:energy-coupling factor transporter transmembrane component T family protein n=1 Tax=Clostridium sp. C105KSO13 TaxID=1776045 RepID=UPI000740634C|nr:energy-coupling factor transporter transmembrane component T [Clostridium sp. C105KSO13]CUX28659.1 Energy-coupling factor transporter transmembrane protein EcfT [Clostridium sp. C105KSO13]
MIRDITIGQYYAGNSVIHELDPRTKLMGALVYIITLFLVKNPWWYILCLAAVLILYRLAQVPLSYFLKGLKGIIILLLFTFIFRLIATPGTLLYHWGIISVTEEGVIKAIGMTLRIALMIVGASLLSYTSTPRELADGLEKSLSFLEKIHIPIQDMAVITMIAFRFIPIMIEELNVLMDAQAARGAEFKKCSFVKKCKNLFSILIPLFLSTVRRASDLAMAMEARGYTGEKQTSRMYPLIYGKNDKLAYVVIFLFFCFFLFLLFI